MKEYQDLIGKTMIAIAIIIAGFLIAQAITAGSSSIHSGLAYAAEMIRDGLLQTGVASS